MSEIWQQKVDLSEKEKKLLADELSKIAKGFQQRECQLLRDFKSASQQLKLQANNQNKREIQYTSDLQNAKQQIQKLVQSQQYNEQPFDSTSQDEVLLTQLDHVKQHNLVLRMQLSECLMSIGRCSTQQASQQLIDKILVSPTSKLVFRINSIVGKFQSTLAKVEIMAVEIMSVHPSEPGNTSIELNQAKKSLMMYINKCNQLEDLLDQDLGQFDPSQLNIHVINKLSIEINHVKSELENSTAQRDDLQQQLRRKAGSNTEQLESLKVELKAMVNDVKQLVSQIQEQESKQNMQTKSQKKLVSQQSLPVSKTVYDEVALLRLQLDQQQDNYAQKCMIKDQELIQLQAQKQSLEQREIQLLKCFKLAQNNQAQSGSQDLTQEYLKQIDCLKNDLSEVESRVRQEHESKTSILAQKLQLLEQQQTLLIKELDHYRNDQSKRSSVQVENERLKKHILSRQQEVAEMRSKTLSLQKQLHKRSTEMEQEHLIKYKDRMTGHLKVFDLELSKLQAILVNNQTK